MGCVPVLGQASCSIIKDATGQQLPHGTRVLFEAKCRTAFVAVPKDPSMSRCLGSGMVPSKRVSSEWYAQVQLGMLVADVSTALLAVHATGKAMIVCIPRDDLWCNMMLKAVQWFMHTFVQTDTRPPPNCNRVMPEYIRSS